MTETYAVLTRMPEPFRMDASTVAAYLTRQWGGRVIAPDAALYESLTTAAARARVMGAVRDALVGLTAQSFSHELLSLDLRAERTYRALGSIVAPRPVAPTTRGRTPCVLRAERTSPP